MYCDSVKFAIASCLAMTRSVGFLFNVKIIQNNSGNANMVINFSTLVDEGYKCCKSCNGLNYNHYNSYNHYDLIHISLFCHHGCCHRFCHSFRFHRCRHGSCLSYQIRGCVDLNHRAEPDLFSCLPHVSQLYFADS